MASINSIIDLIKRKKELSTVDDSLIVTILKNYIKSNKLNLDKLKEKELKLIVKEVRSSLRESVGMFKRGKKNRLKLLEKGEIDKLLKSHSSTKERFDFYPELKNKIKEIKVKSILDLGCGINPIALANKNYAYYASDVIEEDLTLVKKYFEKNKIKGKTFTCNLKEIENCNLPKADLCIIFKVLDVLDKDDYSIAKKIIEKVNCKNLLVSFSTKTLSGKPMKTKRRYWFEKLLERKGISFDIFEFTNEIFYLSKIKSNK